MANNESNLKVPTSEQARINGRKGGLASAKSKKRKKAMQQTLKLLMATELPEGKLKSELEKLDLETDFQGAVIYGLIKKGMTGNPQAFEQINKLMNNEKDANDRKEQRARIKALELKNERLEIENQQLREALDYRRLLVKAQGDKLMKEIEPDESVENKLADYFAALGSEIDAEELDD